MTWRNMLVCLLVTCSAALTTAQSVKSDQEILMELERKWDAAFHSNDAKFIEDGPSWPDDSLPPMAMEPGRIKPRNWRSRPPSTSSRDSSVSGGVHHQDVSRHGGGVVHAPPGRSDAGTAGEIDL